MTNFHTYLGRALIGIWCLLALVPQALAQENRLNVAAEAQLEQWSARLERIGEAIGSFNLDARDTSRIRKEIESIRFAAIKLEKQLGEQIEPARALLDALGEKPENQQESETVARERAALTDNLATISGQQKRAELTVAKVATLLSELSSRKRQRQAGQLMTRKASPIRADAWLKTVEDFASAVAGVVKEGAGASLWLATDRSGTGITLLLSMLVATVVGLLLRPWLSQVVQTPPIDRLPGVQALLGFIRRCLTALPALVVAILVISANPPDDPRWSEFLVISLWVAFWFTVAIALIGSCLAPYRPDERLFPFTDKDARQICRRLMMIATVIAAFGVILVAINSFGGHDDTKSVTNLIAAVLFAIPALSLLSTRLWDAIVASAQTPVGKLVPLERGSETSVPLWSAFRVPMIFGVILVVASAAAGYEDLARFGMGRTSIGIFLLMILIFVHHVVRDGVNWLVDHEAVIDTDAVKAGRGWIIRLIADTLLLVSGVVGFLLLWGTGWEDISDWTNKALEGFQIGAVRVSPSKLLYAAAVFAAILTVTRFLQNKIEKRVLVHTRLDSGVRNSVKSALGYLGVIGGGLIAISWAGLDLSNLALIAGALSVGIGFGLQNVVNNFVSGIILLVERPIRVGDWVVVGENEGYVRKIKVRSTEIETFAHASVIVPNSDLISGTVMNWTHSNARGRIIVPVGVAYGSDTALVRDLLEECAKGHPDVLPMPEPVILFRGFGESSLDFEIRVFLRDIGYCLKVTSDLCFAIDEAFRKNDIEIPFPQRDLHLRDMSQVEALVDKALIARGRE